MIHSDADFAACADALQKKTLAEDDAIAGRPVPMEASYALWKAGERSRSLTDQLAECRAEQDSFHGAPCLVWLGVVIGVMLVGLVMASGRRKG